jgi:hypothetical protein
MYDDGNCNVHLHLEQIVILEMGYKTDSEAKVVEQRDSEIQVEAKGEIKKIKSC